MKKRLSSVIGDESSPILRLIDEGEAKKLINAPSGYGKPWFGQLMCGPQLIAWLWQINMWLCQYKISF
jgi:asparagine synthase (glutamine-hydrolysing)